MSMLLLWSLHVLVLIFGLVCELGLIYCGHKLPFLETLLMSDSCCISKDNNSILVGIKDYVIALCSMVSEGCLEGSMPLWTYYLLEFSDNKYHYGL